MTKVCEEVHCAPPLTISLRGAPPVYAAAAAAAAAAAEAAAAAAAAAPVLPPPAPIRLAELPTKQAWGVYKAPLPLAR